MSRSKCFLSVDIGTSLSKGTIIDHNANILIDENIAHEIISPLPGYSEHDAETHWWGEFVFLVRAWVWYDFEGSAFGEVFKSGNAAVCSASADGDEFFGFGAEVFEFGEVFLVYDDAFEKNDVKYFVFYIFFFADGK